MMITISFVINSMAWRRSAFDSIACYGVVW